MHAEISFIGLFWQASLLVKLVMMTLMSMSIVSWALIIQRSKAIKAANLASEQFEDRFWSGVDLNRLYQESSSRRDDIEGMEDIFYSGFKEYARLLKAGARGQDAVMDGTYRAMRVSLSRAVDDLESGSALGKKSWILIRKNESGSETLNNCQSCRHCRIISLVVEYTAE